MVMMISLSERVEELVQRRADAAGKPADAYVSELVERAVAGPTLREILDPVHQEFEDSGMSHDHLDRILEDALDASRRSRRRNGGT